MPTATCKAKPALPSQQIVVSVNGVVIPRRTIAQEMQHHPASSPIEAWKLAARALAVRELLLQEARRLDLAAGPSAGDDGPRETEEEALVRTLIEREVRTPSAGAEACRRYYDNNRHRFRSASLFEVRHILLAAPSDDDAARKVAHARACSIISELASDPSAFGSMAAAMSSCPSGRTGGSLGQIGPGQTVPEFERALLAMVEGRVHPEPVETRYGFHVVLVERRIDGRELPFELVENRIATWLDEKVRRTAIQQYIAILAERAGVVGIDLPGGNSPLAP